MPFSTYGKWKNKTHTDVNILFACGLATKRGIKMEGASRPLRPEDFSAFDYIIGMDNSNKGALWVTAPGRHKIEESICISH